MIAIMERNGVQSHVHSDRSVVSMRGVGKRYGTHWAIKNVDLTLYPGEIVGFIGPNGAGKTTLMKLMAGLSRVSAGELTVLDQRLDGQPLRTPPGVGLVLEQIGFIPYLSGVKNLRALARLRDVATNTIIAQTLITVGLDPLDTRPVRTYSLGMRQRLGLAQALMEQPQLLLLDEPTNGLDPAGIVDLRKLLRRLADDGVTLFLASHLLTEVERICDRVLLVQGGEVVREIIPSEERVLIQIVVSAKADADRLTVWLQQVGGHVVNVADHGEHVLLHVDVERPTPQIVRELVEAGVNIEEISLARQSLEAAFMAVVETTHG